MKSHFAPAAVIACALIAAVAARHARAATVSFGAAKDNTLFQSAIGDLSNGAGPHLFIGTNDQGNERRALIAFNLAGAIPAGSTINAATLTLNLSKTNTSEAQPIDLHRVLADWGEGASNSGDPGGMGAPAATGDATWLHRFFDTTLWTAQGGDLDGSLSASTNVAGAGKYTWSGAPMAADVQTWVDNPSSNFGWILLGSDIDVEARRFDSREIADESLRPSLTVSFTGAAAIPLPPAALPALGVLAALWAIQFLHRSGRFSGRI